MIAMWSKFAPVLQSVLRIVAAFLFILHGTTKLFAWPASILPSGGTVPLTNMAGIGGLIEVILGPLLLLGLFTQPVAFILAGEMAVAYFKAHASRSLWPILNGGEAPVFFCFLWLYFSAAGAGPLSLDALLRKKA